MSGHRLAEFQKTVKEENIASVKSFFDKNPYSNMTDCARATGLSRHTVMRAVKFLKGKSERKNA